jgi:ABC-type transporter Mla MlaB component
MLRITRLEHSDTGPVLKLEGKLVGPWVDEVWQAWGAAVPAAQRPCLDLSALSFADNAGVTLLRTLLEQDVSIVACSGYVAELLRGDHA